MAVSKLNFNKLHLAMRHWQIHLESRNTLVNYLIHGLEPGSFYRALLCNNAFDMMNSIHPATNISEIKAIVGFFSNTNLSGLAYGDNKSYNFWINLTTEQRIQILISARLIYSEKEEVAALLQGNYSEIVESPWEE